MKFSPLLDRHASTWEAYQHVRTFTNQLAAPLEPEDCVIQSMPDVSPTRWHLAHTTWFFEQFLLSAHIPNYSPVSPEFDFLFNSYYNQVGEQFPRSQRGLLSRPTMNEVREYRDEVDRRVGDFLHQSDAGEFAGIVELGLQHEQQHQELLLTDIKHVFSCNPLGPSYHNQPRPKRSLAKAQWQVGAEGIQEIGHEGPGFSFDNELPRFETLLHPHEISDRLVTCGEYLEFIEAGGYRSPEHWLSLGWSHAQGHQWEAPLYWRRTVGDATVGSPWEVFTLAGWEPIDWDEPVTHVSYYEADAYARWRSARLPTEFEWEADARVSEESIAQANFVESACLHPTVAAPGAEQWYGDAWEWTASSYSPYPGYRPPPGALGEYNGKFMCNQYVLRGGSCATSSQHIRQTYRNFFSPEARWQFTAIRLAR